MERINFANIPGAMTSRPNWIVWRTDIRKGDKPTKLPCQMNGQLAKSNDPTTWASIEAARLTYEMTGNYDGIGYMFADDDNLCGIDLDGCRDPITGAIANWAREIIVSCNTYAEVSPSKTGVKLFAVGKNPFDTGRKRSVDAPAITDKTPAIEIYNRVRYFAVTGWTLKGLGEPTPCQDAINWIAATYFPTLPPPPVVEHRSQTPVMERARRYIAKAQPSISGSGGHNAAFYVACVLVLGFGLSTDESLALMREWNQACQPPWSERELAHKVAQAEKQPGERNYLRDVPQSRWNTVNVPTYSAPSPPASTVRKSTLKQAVATYVDMIRAGETVQAELGIPDIDDALGGGITPGEIIVMAARPSHGKSAVALQVVHSWTAMGKPCLVISEEMSHKALGKRTLQFTSDVPREHWKSSLADLDRDVAEYADDRAECIIVESCGTAAEAVNQIDAAVASHNIELAVVDYAQLLKSPGGSAYEQVTNTCKALVAAARRNRITLIMLCQLNREIEKRKKFIPVMSDLKESGQFEQDADVILFLVWPHRLDAKLPANEYFVFVAKNRDGEIVNPIVKCRFDPSRQSVLPESWKDRAKSHKNFNESIANWNDGDGDFE